MTGPKGKVAQKQQSRPDYLARFLSIFAIAVSLFGAWFSYASSLPVLTAKVELVEPLTAGQQIHFKVPLDNTGRTTAKQMQPVLALTFARADVPFQPKYDNDNQAPANWSPTTSDLGPGGHTTIYSTNEIRFAHDHDVNAVLSGDWRFYIYGKIPYRDILHMSHEFHFCAFYQRLPGADPLKLTYCTSYNQTD